MRLVIVALLVAACGSKSDPTKPCANAAQRGVDAMIDQARKRLENTSLPDDVRARIIARQNKLAGAGTKMKAVFTERCVADKWSDAVIACYAKVDSLEQMRTCRTQLTPEQQAKLQKAELDELAGGTAPHEGAPGVDPRKAMLQSAIADAEKAVKEAKTEADMNAAREQLAALTAELEKLQAELDARSPKSP